MTRVGKQSQTNRITKVRQQQQSAAIAAKPKSAPRRPGLKGAKRLVCPKHVLEQAVDLFGGNLKAARKWLAWPAPDLGWKPPIEVAQTEEGAESVIALIERIGYGTLV